MDPLRPVKEEFTGATFSSFNGGEASTVPQPMEGLHEAGPPPFVSKTFDMVDEPSTAQIVSWSRGGRSFVVWDTRVFSDTLLPKYFKHNNFSSFVRQLNTYGFSKVDPEKWEFANEGFLMGHRHLLKHIRRRRVASGQPMASQQAVVPCVEVGRYGTDAGVDRLRRDKQILMMELVKLRQQQQNTRIYLQAMEERIRGTEQKQQRMMAFLARAMQNPAFIRQLVLQKEKRKELEEAVVSRKRRWSIDQGNSQDIERWNLSLIKAEPQEIDDYGFEVSELEALALEMQGYGRAGKARQEEMEPGENMDKELDEEFWEYLLTSRLEEELHIPETEEVSEDEDVSLFADDLGYLRSSPK